jgi:hypothetical protein
MFDESDKLNKELCCIKVLYLSLQKFIRVSLGGVFCLATGCVNSVRNSYNAINAAVIHRAARDALRHLHHRARRDNNRQTDIEQGEDYRQRQRDDSIFEVGLHSFG